jgi:hypothetical protein
MNMSFKTEEPIQRIGFRENQTQPKKYIESIVFLEIFFIKIIKIVTFFKIERPKLHLNKKFQ